MRLDLLVDNRIIVEVKATETVLKIHSAQLLTYLRLTKRKLGLVLNFGQTLLRDGISRVVNIYKLKTSLRPRVSASPRLIFQ